MFIAPVRPARVSVVEFSVVCAQTVDVYHTVKRPHVVFCVMPIGHERVLWIVPVQDTLLIFLSELFEQVIDERVVEEKHGVIGGTCQQRHVTADEAMN